MIIPETAKTLLDTMILALDAISKKEHADDLRKLRNDLDSQSLYIFDCEDEFESKTRFVNVIMQYQNLLGREYNYKYFYSVNVQKQLMNALRKAKRNPILKEEIENIIGFIKDAPDCLWADCADKFTTVRNFKLVTNLEKLNQISDEIRELPTDSTDGIKMFYKYESVLEKIRKGNKFREWSKYGKKEYVYDTKPDWVMEWWYGLHDTGTYYIYIPKTE